MFLFTIKIINFLEDMFGTVNRVYILVFSFMLRVCYSYRSFFLTSTAASVQRSSNKDSYSYYTRNRKFNTEIFKQKMNTRFVFETCFKENKLS